VTAQEQPGRRDEDNEQRRTRCEQPGVLEHKAIQRSISRDEPGRRAEEQVANTAQRRAKREQPGVQEHEARQLRMARANNHVDMATKFVNGEHVFHQHCGTWDEECVHATSHKYWNSQVLELFWPARSLQKTGHTAQTPKMGLYRIPPP
jgi:hypothetical protein